MVPNREERTSTSVCSWACTEVEHHVRVAINVAEVSLYTAYMVKDDQAAFCAHTAYFNTYIWSNLQNYVSV